MILAAQDVTNDADKKPRLRAVMRQNNSGSLYVFLKIKTPNLPAPKRGNEFFYHSLRNCLVNIFVTRIKCLISW